jgi:hypothetical protein
MGLFQQIKAFLKDSITALNKIVVVKFCSCGCNTGAGLLAPSV